MSALAEALVAAQRRSLATLEKAYVAGLTGNELRLTRSSLLGLGNLGKGDRPMILYTWVALFLFLAVCCYRLWPR